MVELAVDQPDPHYASVERHPLAQVPLGALLAVRDAYAGTLADVDQSDPDDVRACADALLVVFITCGYVDVSVRRRLTLRELAKMTRDPWHNRLRTWVVDRFNCKIRGQHVVKMDSHGRCIHCDKNLSGGW